MALGSRLSCLTLLVLLLGPEVESTWWRKENSGITRDLMKLILAYHNNARMIEGAANMNRLIWDFGLEVQAARWTRKCVYKHRYYGNLGENLAYQTGQDTPGGKITTALKGWYDERNLVRYKNPKTYHEGFHYTQMVWGRTERVGCAYKECDTMKNYDGRIIKNAWFFACFYKPKGNLLNAPAFIEGPACAMCTPGQRCLWRGCSGRKQPFCDNVMPHCNNLAKNSDHCETKKDYMAERCSKACGFCTPPADRVCKDVSVHCYFLIPAYGCSDPSFEIRRACPRSCGICGFW